MSEALNVTKAAFGGLREVTTAPLWQYDYGQILQITGLDLPQAFEVHFSNSRKSGETVTQIGGDNQVTIPDMYLTSGADIYAFIFLHDGLTDGETEYVIKIPVRERPEPSDIEPTPEQQDAITEAIAALNNAVNKADVAITHYPQVIEGVWHVWDAQTEAFVSTGVEAQGEKGDGGLSIFFDCASKPIPTDANRKIVESQTLTFGIYAFKGGEMIDPTSVTAATFICKSGQYNTAIQPTITHDASLKPQWRVSYSLNASANLTLNSDSGTQTANVTVDGVVHKLYFPWSAAKQGVQGGKGDVGTTPDLTIGTVQTLPAGSQATASITGTDEEPVLNLGLPKGDAGDNYVLTEQDKEEIACMVDVSGFYTKPSGGIPKSDLASAVQTSLNKADSALQTFIETDPTVPSWAKASAKPSYTASEVGAIAEPSNTTTGAFLVYDGTGWVAQTLSTWQGGNY